MMYIIFDRASYLDLSEQFEGDGIDYADNELSEFNFEISDIAFELANTRYALAKAEQERDQHKAELVECSRLVEQMQAAEHQKHLELESLRAKIKDLVFVPQGWKVVPIIPTKEQRIAGGEDDLACLCCGYPNGGGCPEDVYVLMIESSPEIPD